MSFALVPAQKDARPSEGGRRHLDNTEKPDFASFQWTYPSVFSKQWHFSLHHDFCIAPGLLDDRLLRCLKKQLLHSTRHNEEALDTVPPQNQNCIALSVYSCTVLCGVKREDSDTSRSKCCKVIQLPRSLCEWTATFLFCTTCMQLTSHRQSRHLNLKHRNTVKRSESKKCQVA